MMTLSLLSSLLMPFSGVRRAHEAAGRDIPPVTVAGPEKSESSPKEAADPVRTVSHGEEDTNGEDEDAAMTSGSVRR